MVWTAEILAVAELVLAHDRPAMAAAVDQSDDTAVAQPGDNDRMPPEIRGFVISFFPDLLAMAEINPHLVENPFHLQIENFRIRVDRPMDRALGDQVFNRGVHGSFS